MSSRGTDVDDVGPVYEVARAAISQQFQVSERLDSKARGIVTIAAGWFAVVQAVAGTAFGVKGLAEWWVYVIVGCAALGAVALLITIVLAAAVWRLRRDKDIGPEGLLELRKDAREGALEDKLLLHYAVVLRDRAANNAARARWFRRAEAAWYVAMALPLVELAFAFAARAFG